MNHRSRRAFLSIIVCFISVCSSASAAEPSESGFRNVHRDYFYLLFPDKTEIDFGYILEPARGDDGSDAEFELQDFSLDVDLPLPLSSDSFLRTGIDFAVRSYDFSDIGRSRGGVDSEQLYKIAPRIGLGTFLSNNLLVMATADVGAYSNLQGGLKEEDIGVRGRGLLVYRLNPGAQLLVGAWATEDFESASVFPVAGFRMLSDDGRIHVSLTAPVEFVASYGPGTNIKFYVGAWLEGEEYEARDFGGEDLDIRIQDRRLGGGVIYWLGEHFRLGVEGGAAIGSRIDLQVNRSSQFNGEVENGGYFAARLGVAF